MAGLRRKRLCTFCVRKGRAIEFSALLKLYDSLREADILATPRPWCTDKIIAVLVLTADTAFAGANIAAATALGAALELVALPVGAGGGTRKPPGTLCALGHGVVQALGQAALGARSLARAAAALATSGTHEAMLLAVAARVSRAHTDVSTAGTAGATLEIDAVRIRASDGVARASCALCHWVFVAWLPLVTALAARCSTRVAAALTPSLAREGIPEVVLAAKIALCLAYLPTALAVTAWKHDALVVFAC